MATNESVNKRANVYQALVHDTIQRNEILYFIRQPYFGGERQR